ncbi:MAG: hypothetical protein GF334_12380 [Candidatus Altiarchaeales archaeon]|nr:hypothetical protein [Candidatus Altiarchaeales archaeon]
MTANPAYRWFFDFYTPLRIPFADVDLNVSDPEKLYRKIDDADTEESFVTFLKHEREVFKKFCTVLAGKDDHRCCWGRYSQRRLRKKYADVFGNNQILDELIPGPFGPSSTAGLQDYSGETYTFYLEPMEIAFQERDGATIDRSVPSYKAGGFLDMTFYSGIHISVKAPDAIYQNIVAKQYLYVYETGRKRTSKVLPARRIDTSIFQVKQPGQYKFFSPSGFYSYLDAESYYLLGSIASYTLKDPEATYTDVLVRIENNAGFKVIQWKDDKHPKGLDLSGVSFVFHYQYGITLNMTIKEMMVTDHYIDIILDNVNKAFFGASYQPLGSPALLAVEFRVVDNVNEFVWDKLPVAASAYPQYGIKEGEAVHQDRVPSEVVVNYRYTALEEGDSFLITQKEESGTPTLQAGEEKVLTWDYMVYTISGVSNQESATTYAMLARTDTGDSGGQEGIQFDKSFLGFVNQLPLNSVYRFDTYQNVYDFMSKVNLENTRFVDLHNVLGDDAILRRFPFNQAKHISWFDIIMLRLLVVPDDREEAPCCFVVRNNRMEWHDPFQAGLDNEYSDRSLICSHVPKLLGDDVIGDRPLVGVSGGYYGFAALSSPDARGAVVRVDPNRTGGIGSGVVTGSRICQGFQYQWGLRLYYNYVMPYDEVYPSSNVVGNPPIYYSKGYGFVAAVENGYGTPADVVVPADVSESQIHRIPGTGTEGGDKKLEEWRDNSVSPYEDHHLYGPVHPLRFGDYYVDIVGGVPSRSYFYRQNTSFCKGRPELLFGMGESAISTPLIFTKSLLGAGGCSEQVTMGEWEMMLAVPPEEYFRNYQTPRKVVVKMTGSYQHWKCYYRPASTTDPNTLLQGHSDHRFTEYRLVELTPFVPVVVKASWSRSVWRNCYFSCDNIGDTQEYDEFSSQDITSSIFDGPEVSMPGSGPTYSLSQQTYNAPGQDPWYDSFEDTDDFINIFETEPATFFYQNVGSRLLKNEDVTHFSVPDQGPLFGNFAAHIPYTMKVGSPTPSVIVTDGAGTEIWDAPTGIASNEGNYWGVFPRNLDSTYVDYVYSIPVAYRGTLLFDVAGNQDIEEVSNLQPDLATVGRDNRGLITWKNDVTENKAYWDIIYVRMSFGSVIPIIILVLPEDLLSKGSDWEVQRVRTTLRRRSTFSYGIDNLINDQYSECAHVQDVSTVYYELTPGSSITVSNPASSKMPDFEGGDEAWTFSLFTPELDDSFYENEGFYIVVPNTNRSWKCFASTTDNPWFNDNFDNKVEATYNEKEDRWELHIPYPEGTEYYVYFWDVVMSSSIQSAKFTAIGNQGVTVQEDEPQDPEYNGQGGVDL